MDKQLDLMTECKWNNVLILDACRYDYFIEEYSEFLDGEVIKAWSPAPVTAWWLGATWKRKYEQKYFSANPYVNSYGKPWVGWSAPKHFREVIDVWKTGWDEELSTVPPWNMNDHVLKFGDEKGSIVHYVQPHQPYIGETKLTWSKERTERLVKKLPTWTAHKSRAHARKHASKDGDFRFIQKAYRDNLRLVLEYVVKLLPSLKGLTVITSDHGEFLGEEAKDGKSKLLHDKRWWDEPILHEVPWMEVRI